MTDKVQKIREEVVRLVDSHDSALDYEAALEDVLNIIDSLQEEPETKFKIGDRVKIKGRTVKGDVIRNIYQAEDGNTYFEFENSGDASADLDWELVEEPKKCMFTKEEFTEEDRKILCEDCEEECEYAKKEKPVSEDFVDAANNALERMLDKYGLVGTGSCLEMFRLGAEWNKQKMMANAIDTQCFGFQGAALFSFRLPADNYLVGSEVKVIVIKED